MQQKNKVQLRKITLAWLVRGLLIFIQVYNLNAAISFMFAPDAYVPMMALEGIPGKVAIQGVGLLFLMWQVPYFFALADPIRYKVGVWMALIMQVIGVVGETILYFQIPETYPTLRSSIISFIIFDAIGVLILLIALGLIGMALKNENQKRN